MKGCSYYQIMYPGFITLPDNYQCFIENDSRIANILIQKKIQALQLIDMDNGVVFKKESENLESSSLKKTISDINKQNITVKFNETEFFIYENDKHYNRIFKPDYFTDIIIAIDSDNNKEYTLAFSFLKTFINLYRNATNNYWILLPDDIYGRHLILKSYYHEYTKSEEKLEVKKRMQISRTINLAVNQLEYVASTYNMNFTSSDISNHEKLLNNFIKKGDGNTFYKESILRAAQEFYIFKNYKYSFLELFFTIESYLSKFLSTEKLKVGISNNKIKEYKGEVGISYLINIELPLVLMKMTEDDKELIGKIDKIRKKRNNIVHNSESVTEDEAKNALDVTLKFLNFLEQKQKNGA